jgi:hypothetical protein
MPLYMDVHSLDGAVTFENVDKAHQADLQTQGSYDVRYLRYLGGRAARKDLLPRRGPELQHRSDGSSRGAWSCR